MFLVRLISGGRNAVNWKLFLRVNNSKDCATRVTNLIQKRLLYRNYSCSNLLLSCQSRTSFNDYEKEKDIDFNFPTYFNFASDVLDNWANKEKVENNEIFPPAFWFVYERGEELKWSFQDLSNKSKKVANMLRDYCNIQNGGKIMVVLPKIPEFWLVNIAAIRTGALLCPGSMMLTAKDIAYRFNAFNPICIVAHETVTTIVDQVAATCPTLKTKIMVTSKKEYRKRPGWLDFHELYAKSTSNHNCLKTKFDDSMMVFFTSGTTGLPKMVEHTHGSYGFCHGFTGRYWLDLTSKNIIWNLSDPGWAKTAYSNIFAPWYCGSGVFIHEMTRFNPLLTLKVLAKYPIDTMCAPPTVYRMLVQENLKAVKFNNLQHCTSGGESLNAEIVKEWSSSTGLYIYEGYGQTETIILLGMFRCIKHKPGSIGKPTPGMKIVILDENGAEQGPGKEGQIAIKLKPKHPPGLFKGYMDDPQKTASCLTEEYFYTGDVAYYDDEGYFWFVGRNDDIIISAGYRIGPFEVENALMEHPAVIEVAVTSSPDAVRGQVVKAFVILRHDYLSTDEESLIKDLQEHVKKVTAPYKYPRKIEFVKELPKTISGKLKRSELQNKEWKKQH